MARTPRQANGSEGEDQAAAHIEKAGLRVLARNWRCRAGELDIVASDADGTLVFVEVRRRASAAFGADIRNSGSTSSRSTAPGCVGIRVVMGGAILNK